MNDKEKRLKALYNLKNIYENLIQELIDIGRPEYEIDEMLDFLSNIMREIKEIENEIK